jgi:hypothetical protein
MENDTKRDDVNSLDELKKNPDWILARVLFQKFGTLHDFHLHQLNRYSISCCNISYGGTYRINADTKTVSFFLQTERDYILKEDKKVKRSKYSIMKYMKVPNSRYRSELKLAKGNLSKWISVLLWSDSKVEVFFDKEMESV